MFEGLLQPMHLLVILGIVLIIFGPGKLPEIGAGLGRSIREFKKALSENNESEQKKLSNDKETEVNKEQK